MLNIMTTVKWSNTHTHQWIPTVHVNHSCSLSREWFNTKYNCRGKVNRQVNKGVEALKVLWSFREKGGINLDSQLISLFEEILNGLRQNTKDPFEKKRLTLGKPFLTEAILVDTSEQERRLILRTHVREIVPWNWISLEEKFVKCHTCIQIYIHINYIYTHMCMFYMQVRIHMYVQKLTCLKQNM